MLGIRRTSACRHSESSDGLAICTARRVVFWSACSHGSREISPGPSGRRTVRYVQNPIWLRWQQLARFVRPFAFRLYPKFSAAKALLGGYASPELRALVGEAIGAVRPEVLACRVRAVFNVNVRRDLAACPVPVLYLRGSRDLVVPSHNLREIQAALPAVQVTTLQAPHMVLQTQPAASASAIASVLEANGAA